MDCSISSRLSLRGFSHGLTLIELIVSVAVISILVLVAVPSLSDYMAESQADKAVSQLVGLLAKTRTEAITRRRRIGACRKANNTDVCAGYSRFGSTSWDVALIFQDTNQNNRFDSSESIISLIDLSSSGIITNWGRGDILFYDGDGTARGMSNGTFQIISTTGVVREVVISLPGRYRVVRY